MGKKRAIKDIWIALCTIIGAILIIFAQTSNYKIVFLTIGIILVIIAIIISLSKAWTK